MIIRALLTLSLLVTIAIGQTSKSGREPQAQGRFLPPFGGFGGFRPGGLFGGGGGGGFFPGGFARPFGYPGLFGGFYPNTFRPGGFYQNSYYGGFGQYPRPGFGNRPAAASVPSVNRPSSNNNINNRPPPSTSIGPAAASGGGGGAGTGSVPNLSTLTPSQAALLGQALGASLRPFLMANGGGAGATGSNGAGSANQLAGILAQLG